MNRRSDSSTIRGWPASVRSCDDGRTSATQGESRICLPAALTRNRPYQRTLSNRSTDAGGTARLTEDKQNALGIVSATYPVGTKARLTLWGDTNRNILVKVRACRLHLMEEMAALMAIARTMRISYCPESEAMSPLPLWRGRAESCAMNSRLR